MQASFSLRHVLSATLAPLVCGSLLSTALAAPDLSAKRQPQAFDDRPALLAPVHPRSEAADDRLEAAALYATGHTLEARQEMNAALRCYARAARGSIRMRLPRFATWCRWLTA